MHASAWLQEDRDRIFGVVRGMEGGFHGFNVKVVGMIREWVAECARQLVSEIEEGAVEADSDHTEEQLADIERTAVLLMEQGELQEAKAM